MKKFSLLYGFLALFTLISTACEEVVEIQLDKADSKVVIDASLSDAYEPQTVKLSKTVSVEESNKFNALSGASIALLTPDGKKVNYREVEPGIYKSPSYRGLIGESYTIEVTAEGKTYSASSRIPERVKLDSLTFRKLSILGNSNTYAVANYNDPEADQNQYRYVLKVNSVVQADVVVDDRFNNGNQIADVIYYELEAVKTNDRIDLELQCIDRSVYKYYFALQQMDGNGGPPVAPSNPISNFNNGALGVFNAYCSSKYGVFVKLKKE